MRLGLLAAAFLSVVSTPPRADTHTGSATLVDAKGDRIGEARLVETPHGVLMTLSVDALSPGAHALHLHDTGACTPPDFESAGAHFNPAHEKHGIENPQGKHAGDLPNLHLPESGSLTQEVLAPGVTLDPDGERTLFDADGSALVVHAKADDYTTDPAGEAGDRIACGVIERAPRARHP